MLDLGDPDYWRDPYPRLARARAAGPTTVTQAGEPVLLRAADVDRLYSDAAFTTPGLSDLERLGIHDGPFYEWRARTLNVMNGADHERLRGYVMRAFLPRQIDRLRGLVRQRVDELLDAAAADGGAVEVVSGFAADLPLWTMCRFLGIAEEDRLRIGAFLTGTEEGFTQRMTPEIRRRVEASINALNGYVAELIDRRTREPGEDIVSDLARLSAEGDGPDADELLALVVNIIGGSVGSTRAALANSLLLLARHPDQAALLRARPALVPRAVEECLRYHPPFRLGRRKAVADIEAFGLTLRAGQTVLIPTGGVNRDPERWADPDRFDVMRTERRHFSFGFGAHFCLGNAIARTNLQEALAIVLQRVERLELAAEPQRVPFTIDEQLDGLHLRLGAIAPAGAQAGA